MPVPAYPRPMPVPAYLLIAAYRCLSSCLSTWKAAEQLDPPSRLGQVNEVMRFCAAKKRDGMAVKTVSVANQRRIE
jgi:hypothetical protein